MRKTGTYKQLGETRYFIPHALPPQDPPFQLSAEMASCCVEASFALGQLNEMCLRLPNPARFIKAYVIKEAMLSSAIEGIHTTLIDMFTCSLEHSKHNKQTQLVLNYTRALDAALDLLKNNIPLTSRVILKSHEVLMSLGEGEKSSPGLYRKQSVRVGELVPPIATEVPKLISDLEKYINQPSELPDIIQTGLVHVHFETIHPFLDGNGRIGRLLIVLMLIEKKILHLPILYPSYYFKKHHLEYYQKLDSVRTRGDFEGWILYYLHAIKESTLDAYNRAKEIEALEKHLKETIMRGTQFAKMRETAELVLDVLFERPVATISDISSRINKAYNTVNNALKQFVQLGYVKEDFLHKRNKLYRFEVYLHLLEKEYS